MVIWCDGDGACSGRGKVEVVGWSRGGRMEWEGWDGWEYLDGSYDNCVTVVTVVAVVISVLESVAMPFVTDLRDVRGLAT